MTDTLFLSEADERYRETYLDGLREFQDEGRYVDWDYEEVASDFPRLVRALRARKTNPLPGKVPETIYWLIHDTTFIGRLGLRHELNDSLMLFGGNIGYEIRPTWRRRGYGKAILRLGLEKARASGLTRVLVTCDDTNIGSSRIIEANGGIWQDTQLLPGRTVPTRRYWITLT